MKVLVRRCQKVHGVLDLGGDKSITHRAIFIASFAHGTSILRNCSQCADCRSTLACMKSLGIDARVDHSTIYINGQDTGGFAEPDDVLDCGNSGTTMRLLCGLLAGHPFLSILSGDQSLRARPMARVIKPLQVMGGEVYGRENDTYPPIVIRGRTLSPINYSLPVASAQVKSSILLAGLCVPGTTLVREPLPTRDHTERMLALYGARIQAADGRIEMTGCRRLLAQTIDIPGDISSAAYFLALGVVAPRGGLKLRCIGTNPTRTGFLEVLNAMGASCSLSNTRMISNEPVSDISVTPGFLQGSQVSGALVPRLIDEIPVIAVLATQAQGRTVIKDAGELRVKETDRIKAIVEELKKMGACVCELEDGLAVEGPTKLAGAHCTSHGDHRIAMALTIAGLLARGETCIDDAGCVDISFPDFFARLREIAGEGCVSIEE